MFFSYNSQGFRKALQTNFIRRLMSLPCLFSAAIFAGGGLDLGASSSKSSLSSFILMLKLVIYITYKDVGNIFISSSPALDMLAF
jgi:hypothetical protein